MFALLLTVAAAALFSLPAMWMASASDLRATARITETLRRRWLGRSLVVCQLAFSMLLLSGAVAMVGQLWSLRSEGLGFRDRHVLLLRLDAAAGGQPKVQPAAYRLFLEQLTAISGVATAAVCAVTPISGAGASRFARFEGVDELPQERRYLSLNWVGPQYLETLGIPLLSGRDFRFDDAGRGRVALVSDSVARHYFRGDPVLGKHFTFEGENLPYEIVGVVGDAKYDSLQGPPPRSIYLHAFQSARIPNQFAIRTRISPAAVAAEVGRVAAKSLPEMRVARLTTLEAQIDASIVPERLSAMAAWISGAAAWQLASAGLFAMLSWALTRRSREIGIRRAFGLSPAGAARMVGQEGVLLLTVGLAAGSGLSWAAERGLATVWPGAFPFTGMHALVAALMLAAAGVVAIWSPARRAARIEPVEVLREE